VMKYSHPVFGPDRIAAARQACLRLIQLESRGDVACGFAPPTVMRALQAARWDRWQYPEYSDDILLGG
jgi:hypothetical protein